ncbi:hypothetical protein QBC36DRAFT_322357 [Triangularia setosa]|uniref:DUF1754-domain-containing protein n=1 Tax=Triangularia setosa TaxID=2587417 RepID=A0AAN7AAP2_9PEZI|nr:hypothetical protein QBC36DRAFT_322357 [Podospora setosa]
MPSEDYTTAVGGSLKLKGVSHPTIKKKKKKSKSKPTDLEKNLSTGGSPAPRADEHTPIPDVDDSDKQLQRCSEYQEPPRDYAEEEDGDEPPKTEAERRFLEAKRKRLKQLTSSGKLRPELLKTHKQRVEELNSHLSRLSEHHDMPKIGPG